MKTKTLRLPVLFASAGALICTVSVARAADASLEVRQQSSSSEKEVINEPSGAERSYTIQSSGPAYQSSSSYTTRGYESGASLDPDAENDRLLHMYQRGKQAAESLDRQVKPNPTVVLPGETTFEAYNTTQTFQHPSELHQQRYSSSFNEPAAAERESTTSSSTSQRYSTSENASTTSTSSTATLSSGTTIKGSDLIGMNIKNDSGERIGEVKDFVVDLKSGRVAYAVVSAGGIAGIGDKWLAVPTSVLMRSGNEKTLTWNIEKEKLQTAPTIDKHNWNAAMQQDYIGNVYNFYGVEPYHSDSEVSEPAGTQKKELQFHHDSDKQNQNQDQKQNDQSRSDLNGQASASTQSSQQSDLQKSEPEKSASSSADISKEAAGAQPSSSSSSSADVQSSTSSQPSSSSSSSAELKSSTDVNAPAGAQSSSSTSSSQDLQSSPSSSTSATQSQPQASSSNSAQVNESAGAASTSSTATTSDTSSGSLKDRVQMALKNDASLSGSAQDIKLSMENDKLVIKGTVKSEDEKNRILEKVRATAGSTQVDDQIKVGSSSDSDTDSSKSNDTNSSSDDNK